MEQVYKAAAQLRQEVKQKAKRSIEKAFLTFSLPQNQGSSPVVSNVERVSTLMNALTGVLSKSQKKLKWRSYSGYRI